jgi:NAD(P)-dependent dehydrogenase (short-subunit alcohol dehydrogenase family)
MKRRYLDRAFQAEGHEVRFDDLSTQGWRQNMRGQTIIQHTPAGRFGEPDELGGTLIWLCSRASAFVNGIVVPVDGGYSAFSGV